MKYFGGVVVFRSKIFGYWNEGYVILCCLFGFVLRKRKIG